MIWYYKDKNAYEYPQNNSIDNSLTQRFRNSVYEDSDEMELYYALAYMKENNLQALDVIFPIEDLSANYGREEDIDKEFCDNNHIHYRYENRSGGCMVLFPGNIITYTVFPSNNFLKQHNFLNDFTHWLRGKGINASTNNNDIMIDDKKVVGATSETLPEPYKGWVYFGLSISINSDPNLINQICTKPMKKIPGALSASGVTTEQVMNWTLEWFNANQ